MVEAPEIGGDLDDMRIVVKGALGLFERYSTDRLRYDLMRIADEDFGSQQPAVTEPSLSGNPYLEKSLIEPVFEYEVPETQ